MAFSLLLHAAAGSSTETSVTVALGDTTGAKLIVITTGQFIVSSAIAPTDNKGNVYTPRTPRGTSYQVQEWECINPIGGAGHTATLDGGTFFIFPALCVQAFTAAGAITFDSENGNGSPAIANIQPGPVSPIQSKELIVTAAVVNQAGSFTGIDSGFTITDSLPGVGSAHVGLGMAYLIQGAAAVVNPKWSGNQFQAATILCYKEAGVVPASVALSVASGPGAKGGTVALNISIASTGGFQCSVLDFTLNFTSDLTIASVTAGPSAIIPAKAVNRIGNQIMVGGFNNNIIPDGVLLTVTFNISPTAAANPIPVSITGCVASDVNGNSLATSETPGAITLSIPLPCDPGLMLDPTTGIISGVPTKAGMCCTTYQVTDSLGFTSQITCCFNFTAGVLIYVLNYRELDSASQIAAAPPVHTSFTGRLIATDHNRKWTRWNIPAVGAALMYREANKLQPVFWLGGNAYTLDADKLTDDDLGLIVPYYTTYFFVTHDQEGVLSYVDATGERQPLGSGRKLLAYLKWYCAGVGQITVTPFVDQLNNPWALIGVRQLSLTPKVDLEWPGGQAQGDRIALKFGSSPITGTDNSFSLQRLTAFIKRAQRLQVRGSN